MHVLDVNFPRHIFVDYGDRLAVTAEKHVTFLKERYFKLIGSDVLISVCFIMSRCTAR